MLMVTFSEKFHIKKYSQGPQST